MKKVILLIVILALMMSFVGCAEYVPTEPTATENAQQQLQDTYEKVAVDMPTITRSLELENIKKRAEFINNPDLIGYLYLFDNGSLIREVQVLGKVSSLNSYMSPQEMIQTVRLDLGEYNGETVVLTQAPVIDGSYGTNSEGCFWFTPDGVYQEWTAKYLYSQARLTFNIQPLLIDVVE